MTSALIVLVEMLMVTGYVSYSYYQLQKENEEREVDNIMLSFEKNMQQTIDLSSLVVMQLATTVDEEGAVNQFDSVAANLMDKYDFVNILQLVPKGVIKHVYPLEGNESVLGYDILADSNVNKEVKKAIERKEIFFAGPLTLRQGGEAVIGRIPIYRNNEFWGLSAVVVSLENFFQDAMALSRAYGRYRLEISKENPYTDEEEFFLDHQNFDADRVYRSKFLLSGEWSVYIVAEEQYGALIQTIPIAFMGTLLTIVFALVIGVLFNRTKRQFAEVIELGEQQFMTLLGRISDGFVALDQNWNYTYVNERGAQILGKTPEELIGKNIWKVFPEGVGQPFYKLYHKALETQSYQYLEEHYAPWDRYFENHIYASQDGLSIFFKDITERKKQERTIFYANQRLKNHLNNTPLAVTEWDAEGRIIEWSPAAEKMFGWKADEVIGKNREELNILHKDDYAFAVNLAIDLLETGNNQLVVRNNTKDGKIIYCQWHNSVIKDGAGEIVSFMSLAQDITEQKQAEKNLVETTRLLNTAQQLAELGSWKINLTDETLFWSDEMYNIHEVDPLEFSPTLENVDQFYQDNIDLVREAFKESMRTGKTSVLEAEIVTAKNNHKWVRVICEYSLINNKQGVFTGSMQDITTQKLNEKSEAEKQERKLKEQATLYELSTMRIEWSLDRKIKQILKLVAETIDCERVSIWYFDHEVESITTDYVYVKSANEFTDTITLNKLEFPTYFSFINDIQTSKVIAAEDAHIHPATREFTEYYLKPHGIRSMLDVCLSSGGKAIGVICHEHIGDVRVWTQQDIDFASSVADLTALILEGENRKKAEEKIRISESRYKALIAASNTGAWEYFADQDYYWCSEEYFTMLGRTQDDYMKEGEHSVLKPWLSLLHPDDVEQAETKFFKYLENPEGTYENYFRMLHKDGHYIWVWSRGEIIRDSNNESTKRVVGTHIDISERKKSEEELKEINDRLRKLSAHLQTIREEERTNIAREIHDELGQQLTGIMLDLSILNEKLEEEGNDYLVENVSRMIDTAKEIIASVRKISTSLRPSILDDLGLKAAIEWHADQFEEKTNINCKVDIKNLTDNYSKEINTTVFRIFQESLTNVLRHANATEVQAALVEEEGSLELEVKDNGVGITDQRKYNVSSLGLIGMSERASMVNGHFSIDRAGERGTKVCLKVPLAT
ncbi:PAS domain S-box protein [Fulvivirga sp. RKSG066]|nr:PAS domain S-box protein [Fulvivirga aurantia]